MFGLLEGFHTSPLMLSKAKGRCENVVLPCATLHFSKGLVLEISTCNFLTIHDFGAISLCQAVPWNMQKAVKGSGSVVCSGDTGEAGFQGAFYWLNIFHPFGCQHAKGERQWWLECISTESAIFNLGLLHDAG